MKLRQKIAAIMAVMILATSLPTFAASTNGMNKIITVAKNTNLGVASAPKLNIELRDELATGQAFYLSLENAEWDKEIATKLATDTNFAYALSSNEKELEVTAKSAALAPGKYSISMLTKVTGGDAAVIIDSNDTVVTSGKYVFAVSNNTAASVTVAGPKAFVARGNVAEITLEEAHIGAFNNKDDAQQVRFELRESGFEFDLTDAKEVKNDEGKVLYTELENVLVGGKAHRDKTFSAKIIDETTLEVNIPKDSFKDSTQRGTLVLTGVKLRATKEAAIGDVTVTVSGNLNDTINLVVAKHGDYGTKLEAAKEYEAVAGKELKDIEFTLSETVPNSLIGKRETVFTFPEGVTIKEVSVKDTSNLIDGAVVNPVPEKKDDKNTNVFTVASIDTLNTKKASVTFKATLNVPAAFDKNIDLVASGRSLEEEKEIDLVKVTAPVTVEVTPVTVKVGLSRQTGGAIVIKETANDNIQAGKIFLAIDDSDIMYTKAPEVKVTEGNLKIEKDAKVVTGGIEITVKSRSTEASTIEISGGELKVDRTVPQGKYAVKVGGTAISVHSATSLWNSDKKEHNDIDAITETDFIIVGTPNTEDMGSGIKNKASFVIGQAKYTVNGEEKEMDTAAYLAKEGRTMLPVRYVSDALGVQENQILWDSANKTVTIIADRVIQVKLGNKSMVINGATIPMTAAAEMKNDRIFIPVAEIARALGANVAWDEVARTATFN